jgi:hypothetical protein
VHAEGRLNTIRRDPFAPIVETRAAEVDVMVAAAHAQITAARCAVAVEEVPDAELSAIATAAPTSSAR